MPKQLVELMANGDEERRARVMAAMPGMKKLDIAGLESAASVI